ncbi:MAG: DNA translocase FtsK 4TM domain-containing protein [Rhodospirillaceae bacterium]|nr:DNA translocase FtsK 4TM domain-containing protein [Rhodospirillaceae bacterium]
MNTAVRAENVPFLPPAWAAMLKRSCLFMAGSLVTALGAAILLALLTYAPDDPSFDTATSAGAQNALGYPGAVVADVLLQAAGLGASILGLAVLAWGVRLMRGEPVTWLWLRTVGALASMLFLAVGLALIPAPSFWPVGAGIGGSAGRVLMQAITVNHDVVTRFGTIPAPVLFAARILFGIVVGVGGVLLALWSITVRPETAGRTGIAAGRGVMAGFGAFFAGLKIAGQRFTEARPAREEPPVAKRKAVAEDIVEDEVEIEEVAAAPEIETEIEDDDAEVAAAPPAIEYQKPKESVVAPRKAAKPSKRDMETRQGSLLPNAKKGFDLPPLDILTAAPLVERAGKGVSRESLESNARMLESVLEDFGIKGQIVKVRPGPVVTLYELEPAPGTKTSRVVSLSDDIARSMSAVSVRIAVVPGRTVIGIELPNVNRETVYLREMLASDEFEKSEAKLSLALGKDIGGTAVFADLARMPHLLVAGTTGSGKSVAINTMIMSLLYRNTPADVRFIMIDPKMLELSSYDGIPHLLAPVVTDPGKAVMALKWTVREMENRYRAMSQLSVRNIAGYNQRLQEASAKGKSLTRTVQTGFEPSTGKPIYEEQALDLTPLPYIVVIIDEMADLMLVAGKEVEAAVQRLAQMARAAGIHVIMATQRPSVDVITGTIKANFPTRISFQVTSKIDSRTILGEQGAEQLLGQGDMLYMAAGGRITRVHGPFVSDREVEEVTNHLRAQSEPSYVEEVTEESDMEGVPGFGGEASGNTSGEDGLFDRAVAIVAKERKASTSFIQRHLQIGYNRAARIIEEMEQQGMISRANHVGKREVLLPQRDDY